MKKPTDEERVEEVRQAISDIANAVRIEVTRKLDRWIPQGWSDDEINGMLLTTIGHVTAEVLAIWTRAAIPCCLAHQLGALNKTWPSFHTMVKEEARLAIARADEAAPARAPVLH